MIVPLRDNVKAAVERARLTDGIIPVDRLAAELAQRLGENDGVIPLMMTRLVIAECARGGLAMRFQASFPRDSREDWKQPVGSRLPMNVPSIPDEVRAS